MTVKITILSLFISSIVTISIAFLYLETNAEQQANNFNNISINHFNKSQATRSATDLSPYIKILNASEVENLSLAEMVPEIVEREEFFETEEREKILKEINPSPTDNSTELEEGTEETNISSTNIESINSDPLEPSSLLINNIDEDENNETETENNEIIL